MQGILDSINSPRDLKNLEFKDMSQLAAEIRQLLIKSVSECGGHLAANLGVVEISIVLHYIFNTPDDKIIWDVGHQSYVHKILTGRQEKMSSLRQFGGMSGFPRFDESSHDSFNTGHSSTSISAALGMAIARDIKGENHSVIAVIGDGALTGGMAFEALNHAGHESRDLLVILNDNEMSISRNVGAMSAYLNRLRTDPSYSRTKEEIEAALSRIPGIGPNIARAANRFKDTLKYFLVPGILFEELGFTYIGPVNGHSLEELKLVLSNARRMKGPILVHTITQKGKGYEPASNHPDVFHGIGPFDVRTGNTPQKAIKTYTEFFGDFLVQQAKEDKSIVAITAAMTSGTGLDEFSRTFPERFFDVGICEQHAVTMAAGMARQGLKPVVAIYSTFVQRAYDQIIHDVAMQNLPVVFAIDRAGLVGEDGPTHHGVFDLSFLRNVPNLTIMAPSNENELLDMLYTAFRINGPVAIRYPRGAGEGVKISAKRSILEPGKFKEISRGEKLAIVAIGRGVSIGREVMRVLAERGFNATLVDARFIKPLDQESLLKLARNNYLVTIEDNCLAGGFGSALLEVLADNIECELLRIGIADEFVEHGKVDLLFDYLNMDPESIADRIISRWPAILGKKEKWELLKFGET